MDKTFKATLTEYPYCVQYTQNGALLMAEYFEGDE